ncbi:N-acetylneuraminate synthase family protein [Verrucomicrobia bacterium]|nr:N-acetylneuraminate synthase family protein [Verrucomicrobiota bacterium]
MQSENKRIKKISEIGINHDGSLEKALEMIRVSADCGADIVKFQMFQAHHMYTPKAGQYKAATGEMIDIYEVVKKMELPQDWIPELLKESKACGVEFLLTICDVESLERAVKNGVRYIKVASYEISHLPLFEAIGKTGLPVIFSTAGSCLGDVEEALMALGHQDNVCVMQCNGQYPAARHIVNMNVLKTLQYAFPDLSIGFSDHTEDPVEAPIAAVTLGAEYIEKHFTLDKASLGPDHCFAVDPAGLRRLVEAVRESERKTANGEVIDIDPIILGSSNKTMLTEEQYLCGFAFRTLYAKKDIHAGDVFSKENITVLRAGQQESGLHPRELKNLIGKRSPKGIEQHEPINWKSLLL